VDHIQSPATTSVVGTYRCLPAVHYLDPEFGLDSLKETSSWLLEHGVLTRFWASKA
jgi:hypothetical protein